MILILLFIIVITLLSSVYSLNLKMTTIVKNFIDGKFVDVIGKSTVGNRYHSIFIIINTNTIDNRYNITKQW